MIPTNQIQVSPSPSDQTHTINETQAIQFPKIDHILAHAINPELSYIYARPELQATATANANTPDNVSVATKEEVVKETKTPKKGRPAKDKKNIIDVSEKKAEAKKPKKADLYDKYYIDTTKIKKTPPPKKVRDF